MAENKLLEIRDLSVEYRTDESVVHAVNHVSLSIGKGETLGLVGETGAGKTTLAMAMLRLLPKNVGRITGGSVLFNGRDLLRIGEAEMRAYRGKTMSMIFQDPMTSLNPVGPAGGGDPGTAQRGAPVKGGDRAACGRDVRAGGHPRLSKAGISAPVLRRHEAARGHRHRAGLRAGAADRG